MGSAKGGQTIGYHYLFSILFGLSRGPINELRQIKVGDKVAWDSHLCNSTPSAINAPDLFGGEKKEGGIQGPFNLFMGAAEQVLPGAQSVNVSTGPSGVLGVIMGIVGGPWGGTRTLPPVKTTIGGLVSEFRGVATLWFDGLISSMNPYPKEWKFRLRRATAGWHNDLPWYSAKAFVFLEGGTIHAMNGAHIIYECYTNPAWGLSKSPSVMDENSFIGAANTLCAEGFGLCLLWQRKEDVEKFIQTVLEHIGAVTYQDPETGKITLKLIRSDYAVADLPLFTPSTGLLDITEDDSESSDGQFNEIIGTGRDPITNEDFQVRIHNLASLQSTAAYNVNDKAYPGIPTKDLMLRVLQRDLRQSASGLTKLNVVLDRRGYRLRPGMPFRISDPRKGISNMVVRAGEITDQSFKDGKITLKVLEDVFGLPATSYVTPVESSWTAPPQYALPAAAARVIEAGYRDLFLRRSTADMNAITPDETFMGILALSPASTMYDFTLASRVLGETDFATNASGSFTHSATLHADITPLATSFTLDNVSGIDSAIVGHALMVDNEIMALTAFNETTGVATVTRGNADTIPARHYAGARVWTIDDDLASDGRSYVASETVEAKVLTRTSGNTLSQDAAPTISGLMVGRQIRPYPPGKATINGDSFYALTHAEYAAPVIAWTHRSRLLEQDQLVAHGAASIGPEPGTTYTIRVYASDGVTLLRTVAGIAGTTWTYDASMQAVDGGPSVVYIELESTRDGYASWQHYRVRAPILAGYSYGYGLNYGGAG